MKNSSKTNETRAFLSFFSVSRLSDFLFLVTTLSASIIPVRKFAERFFWLPWVVVAVFYVAFRFAQQLQVLEVRFGKSNSRDIEILDNRIFGFKVDSNFYSGIKGVIREDKLPMIFVEHLRDLQAQFQADPIKLKDRKLQKASEGFCKALGAYIKKLDDELFHEEPWYLLPDIKRREEQLKYQNLSKQLNLLRVDLLKSYEELINQISKSGGDIREKVLIAS